MNKKRLSVLQSLAYVGQLGFLLITPVVLCTLGAYWLCGRFGFPLWIVIIGVFAGLGGGAVSFYKFAKLAQHAAEQEDEHGPE